MAIVHELNLNAVAHATDQRIIRELLGSIFWSWFFVNEDRVLTTIRWWVIRKTFRVRDLRDVFVLLFGDPPAMLGMPQ